jgi:hypothetical protein
MNAMTFFLVRVGLPNSVAILALALVPLVSLAMAVLPARNDVAHYRGPSVMLVAGTDVVADIAKARAE